MTTNSSNSNPTSSSPKPSNNNTIAIAAVIIVALLGLSAFLGVRNFQLNNTKKELTADFEKTEELKVELEKQYYEALSELEEMRGSNEELNTLIEQQQEELKTQKDKIDGLLSDSRNYRAARKEMANLKSQVEQYVAEINQLREENELLAANNTQLTEQNQTLNSDLESERMNSAQLTSERAILVSEKESLETERAQLAKKVDIASVIKVENIDAAGYKLRKSGKPVKKSNAKNVELIEVRFNTTDNAVTDPGTEFFHVRIINPLGETLAMEELGSGIFTNSATGEQIRYTMTKEANYSGSAESLSIRWTPGQTFAKGNYEVEVYNKGYLAGSTSFQLK
ncbi:MAG: hypothetical protein F6K19_42665 [Cyanothece sp. SIO1E1]|nr:hypothetical protein [Cyanothece sp. SIO1E1]